MICTAKFVCVVICGVFIIDTTAATPTTPNNQSIEGKSETHEDSHMQISDCRFGKDKILCKCFNKTTGIDCWWTNVNREPLYDKKKTVLAVGAILMCAGGVIVSVLWNRRSQARLKKCTCGYGGCSQYGSSSRFLKRDEDEARKQSSEIKCWVSKSEQLLPTILVEEVDGISLAAANADNISISTTASALGVMYTEADHTHAPRVKFEENDCEYAEIIGVGSKFGSFCAFNKSRRLYKKI